MKRKKGWIVGIVMIAVIALLFVGYNIYRYPALTDTTLSTYDYQQQEIELDNQGQRIYGIAYIPDTENEKVPLVICAHGLGGSYRSNVAYAEQLARHTDKVSGLVLMYPAFLVSDAVHEQFDSLEDVPDSFQFNWITAGRPYVEDMWDYDVYEEIGNYTERVLLMHGSADGIVPLSYSDRAAEVYEDVEYYVIDGAGHGFNGDAFDEAVKHIFDYLQEIGII